MVLPELPDTELNRRNLATVATTLESTTLSYEPFPFAVNERELPFTLTKRELKCDEEAPPLFIEEDLCGSL